MPARHLGTTAAKLLLERITGDDQPAHHRAAQPADARRLRPPGNAAAVPVLDGEIDF
ncbi:hypothetical protein ACFQZ4_02085 [Catellatospora coxensis]